MCEIDFHYCEIDYQFCEIAFHMWEIEFHMCEIEFHFCEINLEMVWFNSYSTISQLSIKRDDRHGAVSKLITDKTEKKDSENWSVSFLIRI